ncbi:hypothetical protein KIPB_013749, partial [Kipferlia bialata]|eukprot:g13749.t1
MRPDTRDVGELRPVSCEILDDEGCCCSLMLTCGGTVAQ